MRNHQLAFQCPAHIAKLRHVFQEFRLILERRTLYIEETQYNSIFRCIPLTAKGLTRYRP
jgi:hypothetical protein